MQRQERRQAYAYGDLSDSSWTEEERLESAEQPVAQRQVRRPVASPAQDNQLLLEQETLRDHRSHATGATQLRGHDGQVKQGEQEVLHARDSVGQTSGATQHCLNPGFSERIGNSRRTGGGPCTFPTEPHAGFLSSAGPVRLHDGRYRALPRSGDQPLNRARNSAIAYHHCVVLMGSRTTWTATIVAPPIR